MTYAEAIQFLYRLQLFGTHFGLERTRQLAALAGSPQEKLRFIHVAGTNGKGSTCAMLECIYRAAGLRVGLFTSPHLVSFRERMQINRRLVSEAEIIRLVTEIQPLLRQFPTDAHPTMFEAVAVMALKYFAEQKCELVVWETGLGGRLDATNIVTPLASVITNIAFDHEKWLGDTLAKIAAEKAGIIKPGVPVVTATDAPEALAVIKEIAREKNAPLTCVQTSELRTQTSELRLPGDHQKLNAALAITVVKALQKQIAVTSEQVRAGLASVDWPGRLQLVTLPNGQRILLDGAHNVAGAATLRSAIEKAFCSTRPALIFGALQDKKWPEICRLLAPLAAKILTVPVASERSASASELAKAFQAANPTAEIAALGSFKEAISAFKNECFVVVTGSLYLVGEALEFLGPSPIAADERGLNEWSAKK